jgi:hypothetical protein
MRLARPQIVGGVLVMKAGAAKLLAEPRDADADGREDRNFGRFQAWSDSPRRRRKFPRPD